MSAHRQDDILRYVVDSRSRDGVQHAVELDLYDGNGGCTCEHFTFKLEDYLKKGARPHRAAEKVKLRRSESLRSKTDALRCEHIKEARDQLVDDIIAATMKNRKKAKKR